MRRNLRNKDFRQNICSASVNLAVQKFKLTPWQKRSPKNRKKHMKPIQNNLTNSCATTTNLAVQMLNLDHLQKLGQIQFESCPKMLTNNLLDGFD